MTDQELKAIEAKLMKISGGTVSFGDWGVVCADVPALIKEVRAQKAVIKELSGEKLDEKEYITAQEWFNNQFDLLYRSEAENGKLLKEIDKLQAANLNLSMAETKTAKLSAMTDTMRGITQKENAKLKAMNAKLLEACEDAQLFIPDQIGAGGTHDKITAAIKAEKGE